MYCSLILKIIDENIYNIQLRALNKETLKKKNEP